MSDVKIDLPAPRVVGETLWIERGERVELWRVGSDEGILYWFLETTRPGPTARIGASRE